MPPTIAKYEKPRESMSKYENLTAKYELAMNFVHAKKIIGQSLAYLGRKNYLCTLYVKQSIFCVL